MVCSVKMAGDEDRKEECLFWLMSISLQVDFFWFSNGCFYCFLIRLSNFILYLAFCAWHKAILDMFWCKIVYIGYRGCHFFDIFVMTGLVWVFCYPKI